MKSKILPFTLLVVMAFGCQKETKTSAQSSNVETVKAVSFARVDSSASDTSAISVKTIMKNSAVANCGIAIFPPPVVGNGTVILPVGTLLATYQPIGETKYQESISFGEATDSPYGTPYGIGKYRLTIQGDGNLVLRVTRTGQSLWSSQTAAPGGDANKFNCYLVLQNDGNLILKIRDKNGIVQNYWATQKVLCANQYPPILVLQSDGNIVEKYECAHKGPLTHGFIGGTGTGGGNQSNHTGSF